MRRFACVALTLSLVSLVPIQPAAAAAAPLPRDAVILTSGHGWGHGRGMGQWGARGMASSGKTYTQILTHYYTGVTFGTRPASEDIRVLVESSPSAIVTSDSPFSVTWADGNPVASSDATYRFFRARWDGDRYRLEKSTSYTGPWTFVRTGGQYFVFKRGSSVLQLVFDSGTVRYYRGSLIARRTSAGSMNVINRLAMREYLYSVVPHEMPASWPAEALKAQAVAARTFAANKKDYQRSNDRTYDVCATTSCQLYLGYATASAPGRPRRGLEASSTTKAVDATAGRVLLYRGAPILAEFSSSTGGYSAPGNVPYQRAVPDPGDAVSTHHNWTARLTVRQIEQRWTRLGRLVDVRVTRRNGYGEWGGRVETLQLVGTSTSISMSGTSLRSAFAWPSVSRGLQSTWFYPLVYKGDVVSAPPQLTVASGEAAAIVAQIRNTGSGWWPVGGTIRLVASSSRFHAAGWFSDRTAASVSRNVSGSGPVGPGQIAEFRIPIDAAAVVPGTYPETFTAVNEGTTSMTPSFTVRVQVLPGLREDTSNLVGNGSFESGLNAWRGSGMRSGDGDATAARRLGGASLRLAGGTKSVSQTVTFAGGTARGFVLGAWNRGDATSASGGAVEVSATIRHANGSTSTVKVPFSRAAHPWTYDERFFSTSSSAELSSITVRASVANQRGASYFDAVRLVESAIANPSFEDGMSGWRSAGVAPGDGPSTADVHDGVASLAFAAGGAKSVYQTVAASGRRTERFVLTAWSRGHAVTSGTLSVKVTYFNRDGSSTSVVNALPRDAGWRRSELVLSAPKDFARVSVGISAAGTNGPTYVDALRLARTFTTNPSLEQGLAGWTPSRFGPEDGLTTADPREGARALVLGGGGHQNAYQRVSLSGGAGFRLTVSAWNRTAGTSTHGGTIGLMLGFRNTDGTTTWRTVAFPETRHGWQYFERTVASAKKFSRVDVYVVGYDQPGVAVFDGIGLRRA